MPPTTAPGASTLTMASPRGLSRWTSTCRASHRPPALLITAKASVDVELVPLGVLHPHRVVIEAVLAQGSGGRSPEIGQPPGLGVDSLHAGGERVRTAAADVDVEVEAVLDHLGRWHHMEPDAGAVTVGIDDAVRADSQLAVGKPDVASPVVPGREPFGGRFKHVSQRSRPETGQQLGVPAVDDELESGRHRAPLGLYTSYLRSEIRFFRSRMCAASSPPAAAMTEPTVARAPTAVRTTTGSTRQTLAWG